MSPSIRVLVAGLSLAWVGVMVPREQRAAILDQLNAAVRGDASPAVAAFSECQAFTAAHLGDPVGLHLLDYTETAVTGLAEGTYLVRVGARIPAPDGSVRNAAFHCTIQRGQEGEWLLDAIVPANDR